MARAYSNDLRERVVAAVELDGMSCREAAAQFSVGVSTAIRWLARYRGSGSVAPAQIGVFSDTQNLCSATITDASIGGIILPLMKPQSSPKPPQAVA